MNINNKNNNNVSDQQAQFSKLKKGKEKEGDHTPISAPPPPPTTPPNATPLLSSTQSLGVPTRVMISDI